MELGTLIKHLFPQAVSQSDYIIQNDGNGSFIGEWNLANPQPTEAELQVAWEKYQANPPQPELSELEKLQQQQELMQQAIDDLIFGGGF